MNNPGGQWMRIWALSLALPVVTVLVTIGIMSIPRNTQGVDLEAGQAHFVAHCSSCHFTRREMPAFHGPNLHDIGRTAGTRKPNQSAEEYILESILDPDAFISPNGRPGMPIHIATQLAPEEIRDIVAYLSARGSFPDFAALRRLEIPDRRKLQPPPAQLRLDEMQLAEKVLREKGSCLNCHSLYNTPEAMVFAPAIFTAGLSSPQAIRESLIDPHKTIDSRFRNTQIMLQDGEVLSGRLMSRTKQNLVLCMLDQQNQLIFREIAMDEIEQDEGRPLIRESAISIMPAGFDQTLSPEEIEALINLIRQLN